MIITTTDPQHISVERRGHISVITLDRPDRLNDLNRPMAQELHDPLNLLA